VTPRAASTTLVVRDGAAGLEVLMLRRSSQASFMPGSYVFPGGAVDAADGAADAAAACDESPATLATRIGAVTEVGELALAHAVAALRECFEECGLWLGAGSAGPVVGALRARVHAGDPIATLARDAGLRLSTSALQPWSHWVTPFGLPKRFDTLFFVAHAPQQQKPEVDAGETTTLAWVQPGTALAARNQGEFPMEFATVKTVESLLPFASSSALFAHAAAQTHLPALHPRLRLGAEGALQGVLLPGQPGYDDSYAP
jgi:8-oxo-dGTP pyrophosphatase MutT (NUDIX family)